MGRFFDNLIFFGGFIAGGYVGFTRLNSGLRGAIQSVGSAEPVRNLLQTSGVIQNSADGLIAGAALEDAIAVAKTLNAAGMSTSLRYLADDMTFSDQAVATRDATVAMAEAISAENLNANLTVNLLDLGLHIDPALASSQLATIVETGAEVVIGRVSSADVERTLSFQNNTGITLDASLYRTAQDVANLNSCTIRLTSSVESNDLTFHSTRDRAANFGRITQLLLADDTLARGIYPAFATNSNDLAQVIIDAARDNEVSANKFEFVMNYGVRPDLQTHLVELGYQVRVIVPFGNNWYPYVMTQLAEEPAALQRLLLG